MLSLTDDRYIDVHANNNYAFISACRFRQAHVLKILLSLKGNRKFKLDNLSFNPNERNFLLNIMIRKIYRDRKKLLMIRKVQKNKRVIFRELKSLPKCHVNINFPGGIDYIKMINRYL